MARLSLAVACLVLSVAANAHGEAPCACGEVTVLPAAGARDVPRNTKVWLIGGGAARAQLDGGDAALAIEGVAVAVAGAPIDRFDLQLDGSRAYRFTSEGGAQTTRFTTSDIDDTTPPAAPVIHALALASADYMGRGEPLTDVQLDAALAPDVALLHFTFRVDGRESSAITTPDGWRALGRPACHTGLPYVRAGDHVIVSVSAIDLAGNESVPVTREVDVWRAPETQPACAYVKHWRCGTGDIGLLFIGVVAGVLLLVIGIAAIAGRIQRSDARRRASPEPISLLVAERVARAVQRRGGMWAAIGIAGVPALVMTDDGLLAILSTIVACIGLRGFAIAHTALRLIEAGGARVTAEAKGPSVIVRGETDEARLDVSPRALARARRHAVPASVRRRP